MNEKVRTLVICLVGCFAGAEFYGMIPTMSIDILVGFMVVVGIGLIVAAVFQDPRHQQFHRRVQKFRQRRRAKDLATELAVELYRKKGRWVGVSVAFERSAI